MNELFLQSKISHVCNYCLSIRNTTEVCFDVFTLTLNLYNFFSGSHAPAVPKTCPLVLPGEMSLPPWKRFSSVSGPPEGGNRAQIQIECRELAKVSPLNCWLEENWSWEQWSARPLISWLFVPEFSSITIAMVTEVV